MRRNRSQLRHLAGNGTRDRHEHGQSPSGPLLNDMQRRVDALYADSGYPSSSYPNQAFNPYAAPSMPSAAHMHPPMYADYPPAGGGRSSAELEELRHSIEQMSARLMGMEANRQQANALPDTQATSERIVNQIHELKETIANIGNASNDRSELASVKNTLTEMSSAFREVAGKVSQNTIEPQRLLQTIENGHKNLQQEIGGLRQTMQNGENDTTNILPKMLEASHNELQDQLNNLQNMVTASLGNSEDSIGQLTGAQQTMLSELDDIKSAINQSLDKPQNDNLKEFNNIEMRLEEITRALVAVSHDGGSTDHLERVEARLSDLSKQMESMVPQNGDNALADTTSEKIGHVEARLFDLTKQIETISIGILENSDTNENSEQFDRVEARLSDLANQVKSIGAGIVENPHDGGNVEHFERLEARLSDLVKQVESVSAGVVESSHDSGNVEHFERVEARLSELSRQIETMDLDTSPDSRPVYVDQFNELKAGLSHIGNQVVNISNSPQLSDLSQKLDSLLLVANDGNSGVGAEQGISQLLERLDQLLVLNEQRANSGQLMPELAEQLQKLETVLLERTGAADIANYLEEIDKRVVEMSNKFDSSEGSHELLKKLESIEEQVANSREVAIELANEVASDAVRQAVGHLEVNPGQQQAAVVDDQAMTDLLQNVRSIQDSSSLYKSETIQSFDVVRESLESVATRLSKLETAVDAATRQGNESLQFFNQQTASQQTNLVEPEEQNFRHELQQEANEERHTDKLEQYQSVLGDQKLVSEDFVAADNVPLVNENSNQAVDELFDKPTVDNHFSYNEPAINPASNGFVEMPDLPEAETPAMTAEAFASSPDVSNPDMEETPLAPGTANNDLADLVRQANERQRATDNSQTAIPSGGPDFIAAARRAAQAAALKAEQSEDEGGELSSGVERDSVENSTGKSRSRKKVIVVSAILALLVAASIPIAGKVFGLSGDSKIAAEDQVKKSAVVEDKAPEENAVVDVTAEAAVNEETQQPVNLQPQTPEAEAPEPVNVAEPKELVTDQKFATEIGFGPEALKASVESGNPEAWYEVGRRYMDGQGTKKDLKQAAVWFERAANSDLAPAQYLIGNFAEKGIGVDRDLTKAVGWYEKAAENGNIVAMHNLAVIHATPGGLSEKPDMNAAYEWFKKAAEHGVRDSQVNLGIFYTKGIGAERDLVEAYKWFTIAAKSGDKDSGKKRDVVAEALRPDQLEAAKKAVEDWRPAETDQKANRMTVNPEWTKDLASKPVTVSKQIIAKTQFLLSRMGFDAGPADGIMGEKTKRAIAQFQKKNGLSATGQITTEFLQSLEKIAS